MDNQWWSWALSIIGATCFYLAGKKVWWTWYLGLFTQLLWLGYTLVTQQWGFLVGVFLYTFVYSKNARDWTRDHFIISRNPIKFEEAKPSYGVERGTLIVEGEEIDLRFPKQEN